MKLLRFLQKNLVWSIPGFMIAGMIYGQFFETSALKLAIVPFTFLMVYPMMVNLNFKKVFSGGDSKVQITAQLINFGVIPFLGFFIGITFFSDSPYIMLGLLLTSLLPTSGMTISWTGFAKGNMPAAVKMTVIGLILGSIFSPFYLQVLAGASIHIPLMGVFKQIIIIVFLPMILGFLTQQFLVKRYGMARYQKDIKKQFPPFSTFGVLSIVFIAMALKSGTIISNPILLIKFLLPLTALYIFNFGISTIIGKYLFNREDGIALVYGTVMRNLSIALAIAMTVFKENGSEIALIIALAYIIQVQAGAWYVKAIGKIFGPMPPDTAGDVMHEGVFSLYNDDPIKKAIRLLQEEHIHSLVILDNQNQMIGLLSSEMILDYLSEDETDAHQPISAIKLDPVIKVLPKVPLLNVIKTMKRKHEYTVVVIDEKGNPQGAITESDLLKKIAG